MRIGGVARCHYRLLYFRPRETVARARGQTLAAALNSEQQNAFQALAITATTAIAFETIGRGNPLAATTHCLMISAFNIPITYMVLVDGSGYARDGIAGSYAADASLSLFASLLLGAFLIWRTRRRRANSNALCC